MIFAKEAATKKIEQGLERNRFRRNTRQFKIFPTIPTIRRIPNRIVRYSWIRVRILIRHDMFISILKRKNNIA
jgi:hypothetical protein